MSINITVKSSMGGKFSLEVTSFSETIAAFKGRLAVVSEIPSDAQRLIFRGHVLKDTQTFQDIRDKHGLESGQTMHVVRGTTSAQRTAATQTAQQPAPSAAAAAAAAAPLPGASPLGAMFGAGAPTGDMAELQRQLLQNPEQMRAVMNSPMMDSIMNNPELARSMMMATPQMRELIERNPEVGHVFNDPSTFRQMMQIARNPSLMNEMMRNTDRQMANIEMMPGGFDALRRMQENIQAPLMDAVQGLNNPSANANDNNANNNATGDNPFASLFQNTPSNAPMPNPWAPNNGVPAPAAGTGANNNNAAPRQAPTAGANNGAANPLAALLGGMGGMGGAGGAGGAPRFPVGVPEQGQMDQMLQMMENPMMQQMLQSMVNDPAMLETMINSNPQLQALTQDNPEMAAMMRNPGIMQSLINPDVMRSLAQFRAAMGATQGGNAANTTAAPAGTAPAPNAPPRAPGTAPRGVPETAPGAMPGAAPGQMDMNGILAMMNAMGGLGAQGGAAAAPPQPELTQAQLEQMYSTQLAQLRDMGFLDTNMCLQALRRSGGNVAVAVENLLNQLGG